MPFGLTVAGRIGQDPELRATAKGTSVANFSVAVSGYNREQKEKTTTWVRVTMWGDRGEQIAKLLGKGDAACFMGTGELKTYEKKNGETVTYLECTASECVLLGKSQVHVDEQDHRAADKKRGKPSPSLVDDDEIPY